MSTLFQYKTTALMAAKDDDYIRLEIEVTVPKDAGKTFHCKQIEVGLPVGEEENSISTLPPIPFVDTPRWIASQGTYSESMQPYVFDDIKAGEVKLDPGSFKLGFRVEKAGLKSLTGFTIPLTEHSRTGDAAGFDNRTAELEVSFKVIKPSILYFIAEKNDQPCTHFKSTDAIQLSWQGSLVDEYVLYVGDQKIPKGQDETHVLESLKKDTSLILKGIGHLGTDKLEVYQTLNITISDPTFEGPLATGGSLAVGHTWDGVTTTPVRIGKPGTGGAGAGMPAGTWSAGSAFMQIYDVKDPNKPINKGTNIGFWPHPWGGDVVEKLTVAANGNVGIGTTEPTAKLEVDGDTLISGSLGIGTTTPSFKLNVDPKGPGGILIGNSDWKSGGYTSLQLKISAEKDGQAALQVVKSSGSAYGDLFLNKDGGNVRIGVVNGTSNPSDKALLSLSRGYSGPEGNSGTANAILEINTGNTANGYLWGGAERDWDEFNVSFNHYRFANVDAVPNTGYGSGCMTFTKHSHIVFKTNTVGQGAPTEKMRLTVDGKVGIGTATPTEKLEVKGNVKVRGDVSLNRGTLFLAGQGDPNHALYNNFGRGAGVEGHGVEPQDGVVWNVYNGLNIRVGGDKKSALFVKGGGDEKGNVVIGNGHLVVHGRIWFKPVDEADIHVLYGDHGHEARLERAPPEEVPSDRSLKRNIQPLGNALSRITSLNGVHFEWNEKGHSFFTKNVESTTRSAFGTPEDDQRVWAEEKQKIREQRAGRHWGFVAQEVEKVFPEWVGTNEAGYKTLNTAEMLPLLVEGIKEQQREIEQLKAALARLSE